MSITATNRAIKIATESINLLLKKYNNAWVTDYAKVNRVVMGEVDHAIFNEIRLVLLTLNKVKELMTKKLKMINFNAVPLNIYLKKNTDREQFLIDNPSYCEIDQAEWVNDIFVNISTGEVFRKLSNINMEQLA